MLFGKCRNWCVDADANDTLSLLDDSRSISTLDNMEEVAKIPVRAAEVSQISLWPQVEYCCWQIPSFRISALQYPKMNKLRGLRIVLGSHLREDFRLPNLCDMESLCELIIEGSSTRSRPTLYSFHIQGFSDSITKLALANVHLQNDRTDLLQKFRSLKWLSLWKTSHRCSQADRSPVKLPCLTHLQIQSEACQEHPCQFLSSIQHPESTQKNVYMENRKSFDDDLFYSSFSPLLKSAFALTRAEEGHRSMPQKHGRYSCTPEQFKEFCKAVAEAEPTTLAAKFDLIARCFQFDGYRLQIQRTFRETPGAGRAAFLDEENVFRCDVFNAASTIVGGGWPSITVGDLRDMQRCLGVDELLKPLKRKLDGIGQIHIPVDTHGIQKRPRRS